MQMLFLEYINQDNRLNHQPRGTILCSNCTTILFDLMNMPWAITARLACIVTGLITDYLYYTHNLIRVLPR